jgi:hydrogenase-4 component B
LLVVHYQQDESNRAAATYIFMGLIGGFLILVAMMLLYFEVGDLSFESALGALNQIGNLRYWIIGLLIFGFGVKAGMVPVHMWLPKAHPVAPTPASALLSGILIKVGAYGILRVATSYYFPVSDIEPDVVWLTIENVGFLVIWAGIITMTVGVFMALQQAHVKRMLAYHSVSQMGYIITGVGIAMYLGDHGAVGYAGAVYHIVNHALFKSLLFLVAGVVYHHTHELDMYKLGGLWKKLPVTTFVALIAALGISGIPLFNGFISKSILHHGIVEAVHEGSWIFTLAEWIFIVVSAGTVASFIKLMYYVFFRKTTETYQQIGFEWDGMNAAMIGLAGLIGVIGIAPNFIMKRLILPQIESMSFDPHFVEEMLSHMNYFNGTDLLTMAGVVFLGAGIFYVGKKYHLFHLHLPKWLSIEYLILYPLYMMMYRSCKWIDRKRRPLDEATARLLSVDGSSPIGFLERFQITVKRFNDRYEEPFIQSDSLIYTGLIVLILIFVLIRVL